MMMVVVMMVMFSLLMDVMVIGMVTMYMFGNCLRQGTQHLGRRGRRRSR